VQEPDTGHELLSSLLAVQAEPKSQSSAAAVADETAWPDVRHDPQTLQQTEPARCPNDIQGLDRPLRPLMKNPTRATSGIAANPHAGPARPRPGRFGLWLRRGSTRRPRRELRDAAD